MPRVHPFQVVPALPEALHNLRPLAFNLHWAWDNDAIECFRRLDQQLWEECGHNPVRMLGSIDERQLAEAAQDETYVAQLDKSARALASYMNSTNTWYRNHVKPDTSEMCIGYFSMEFGITECLPVYSGGLGVLSGDHLKSSSDLGLPLVGVGLLYQQGYFRQYLNAEGWQQERYPQNDFYNMPVQPVLDDHGTPLRIAVNFPGRQVWAQVWRVQVGRIPLYLLDTNIDANSAEDQAITAQLYGGDLEMRLKQEIVLGIGGVRALAAMGVRPTICHMNEGHSAFMALERSRMLMADHGVSYAVAREATAAGCVFTTHTPVPAGFDVFPQDLLRRYFGEYVESMGISFDEFFALGRKNRNDSNEQFNMAIFALRHSHHCNGVSRLHGEVTRHMVKQGYEGFPLDEVPVGHVTNGIHTRSFISSDMATLLDRYLGGRWSAEMSHAQVWDRVEQIPDEELWRVRQRRRERLVVYARQHLKAQYERRGMSEYEIRQTQEVLSPNALTIGFARRFATYKRATLLFSDPERLKKLLNDPHRPVQILLAGKAHPRDDGGKELIRQIVQFARNPEVRARIVFLEDYDLSLARYLVQGVDVWLNTPRRPMEASGTSGMKVLPNGGLNLSIPDGWWDEGYSPDNGWRIGRGEEFADPAYQDHVEALALYDLLEKEVVPLFYDRSSEGLPRAWVSRIKNSMRTLCPVFNTHRMVAEYARTYYMPASERATKLRTDNLKGAFDLVQWKARMQRSWSEVAIEGVTSSGDNVPEHTEGVANREKAMAVGTGLTISARVKLGPLNPEDVVVQAYHGALDSNHEILKGVGTELTLKSGENGSFVYEGVVPCGISGLRGFSVRVLPFHAEAVLPHELNLITWE
jgi:starch phosphorylase